MEEVLKYTEGVWYDAHNGEYCRVVVQDGSIGLVEPDRPDADPYYENFRQIHNQVVENPADYISLLHTQLLNDYTRNDLSVADEIALQYALDQVEIVEKEE